MIEKSYEKTYKLGINGISQSSLTRAANRLIADYTAVFGASVENEIKDIADAIKRSDDAEEYEYEYSYECNGTGGKIYDKVKYTYEANARAFWDEDEYGDAVYCISWYFFSSEYYTKRVGKKVLHATTYHDINKKAIAEKGKYRYFCTHRPPSAGCIPAGYASYDTYSQGQRYIGEVTYNEEPSDDELENWGLVIDKDWNRIRQVFLESEE